LHDVLPILQSVVRDISDHIRSEEAWRRFRTAMDLSPDLILLIDRTRMRFIDVNETACTKLGYTREELLELGPHDVAPLGRDELARAYDQVIAGTGVEQALEMDHRRKDGSLLPVEVIRRAVRGRDGHIIVVIARDITEKRRTEEQFRRAAEQTRNILSSIT